MDYEALERVLGHTFQDKALLETALTHTSFANEARHGTKHNERLEFLGDSVLSIVVAEYLFTHSSLPEGDLTRMRAQPGVRGRAVHLCPENSLGRWLRLGHGEEMGGGRTRPSVVSDAFEAVIAALYLDGGIDARALHSSCPSSPRPSQNRAPKRIIRQNCRRLCSKTPPSGCAMWWPAKQGQTMTNTLW